MKSTEKYAIIVKHLKNIFGGITMQWYHWLGDLVVLIFIVVFAIVCAKRGFIDCFFSFVSTILSLVIAFSFAKLVVGWTNGLFGLQGLLDTKLTEAFSKMAGFNEDISAQGVEAAMQNGNVQVSAILGRLILNSVGQGDVAVGTTLGMLCGEAVAKLACTLLCGVALYFLTQLILLLLKGILNGIANSIPAVDAVNTSLGALVGVIESVLLVCVVLSVLTLFPSVTISNYLNTSILLGFLYNHNPLVLLISVIL